MDIEPRHVFFFVFLAITLIVICGIGDGVLSGPDTGVAYNLMHGNLAERVVAFAGLWNMDYDWLTPWLAWPFRIIEWIYALLILRFLWKLVPVIGR